MPMGSTIMGYVITCDTCKSGVACPCLIASLIMGDSISEVISKALSTGGRIDRVVFEVGGEFVGFYDPGANALYLRADAVGLVGDGVYNLVLLPNQPPNHN